MDKATGWPYDIGATLASRSSHQSQVLGGNGYYLVVKEAPKIYFHMKL